MDYCKIGDISFDSLPIWIDQHDNDWLRSRVTITPTLTSYHRAYRNLGSERGRPITLDCAESWQKCETVKDLKEDEIAMAMEGNTTRLFEYSCGETLYTASVIYRSDQAGGAIKFQPLVPIAGQIPDGFRMVGKVSLMVW